MKLKTLQRFIQDEKGLESAEFAMVLALICIAIVSAVIALISEVESIFNSASDLYKPW